MKTILTILAIASAAAFSLYLHKRRPAELHAWFISLLSTLLSVALGVVAAIYMFGYQDAQQSQARRDQLAGLVALELKNDLDYLRREGLDVHIGTNTWHFKTGSP